MIGYVRRSSLEAWLAAHLPNCPTAAAWDAAGVRVTLVVVVRDTLRDGMAPSVENVAAWLVNTAVEQDDLLRAAHAAAALKDFRPQFVQAADFRVADGGSEYLPWTYLIDILPAPQGSHCQELWIASFASVMLSLG